MSMNLEVLKKCFRENNSSHVKDAESLLLNTLCKALIKQDSERMYEIDEFATLLLTLKIIDEVKKTFNDNATIKAARYLKFCFVVFIPILLNFFLLLI